MNFKLFKYVLLIKFVLTIKKQKKLQLNIKCFRFRVSRGVDKFTKVLGLGGSAYRI